MKKVNIGKFGGGILFSAECFFYLLGAVKSIMSDGKAVVVVSALGKTTRLLKRIVENSKRGLPYSAEINDLASFHHEIARHVLKSDLLHEFNAIVEKKVIFIWSALNTKQVGNEESLRAAILSVGEYLASKLVAFYLKEQRERVTWVDATDIITTTDDDYLEATVDQSLTKQKAEQAFETLLSRYDIVVTQGYVAKSRSGLPAVLGNDGSDYSATILGLHLEAGRVTKFADVDGLYEANPKESKEAKLVSRISKAELIPLVAPGGPAYGLIFHKVPALLLDTSTEITIQNFRALEKQGTVIY